MGCAWGACALGFGECGSWRSTTAGVNIWQYVWLGQSEKGLKLSV